MNCYMHPPHKRSKRTVTVREEISQDESSSSTEEEEGEIPSSSTEEEEDSEFEEDNQALIKAFWGHEAALEKIRVNLERQLMRVDVDYGDKITTAAFMDFVRRHTSVLCDL